MQNAWNKYGPESFQFSVICECPEIQLDELERYYIELYQSNQIQFGYNEESGGCKLKHHSERSKKLISEKTSGKNNPMYGVHIFPSEETRNKLREAQRGENNGFYGKHHTEDAKKRMSEKKKGMTWPLEVIFSRGQNKRVRCVNNGKEFDMISLAAQWAKNTAPESISRVCKHKQKTAGIDPDTGERLKWEYIELSHTAQ